MNLGGRGNKFRLAVLVLLAGAVVGGVPRLRQLVDPRPSLVATHAGDCDLRVRACTASFEQGGSVTLAIGPDGIPVLTPLTLTVEVRGLVASEVMVDFVGVGMSMGYNRPTLRPAGAQRFVGSGMLPACVRDTMTWDARVLLQTPVGLLAAPFRFEVRR